MSQKISDLLKECGIISQIIPTATLEWNGMLERRNRTLLDMVRSMLGLVDLPISFWGHALLTAAFTLNRVPTKKVEKTPYEVWTGKRPGLSFMWIWGCDAFVKRITSDKLGPKSDKFKFVEYPKETK